MATTETFIGQPVLRKEDPELITGPGELHRQLDHVGDGVDGPRSAAVRACDDRWDRHVGGGVDAGCGRRVHRRGPRAGRVAFRVADHRGHQGARALRAGVGQGPVQRRRRCGGGRGDACAGDRCRGGGRGHRDRAPRRHRPGASGEGRGADPRRPGDELGRALEPRRRRRPVDLRLGAGGRAGAVRAAAADPERDRATRVSRVRRAGDGRVDPRVGHADPAHREGHAVRRDRHRGAEAPGDRPGRRRRLRLEAQRLRRGGARARPRAEARAPGEVDRGSPRRTTWRRPTGAA